MLGVSRVGEHATHDPLQRGVVHLGQPRLQLGGRIVLRGQPVCVAHDLDHFGARHLAAFHAGELVELVAPPPLRNLPRDEKEMMYRNLVHIANTRGHRLGWARNQYKQGYQLVYLRERAMEFGQLVLRF